jgi:hypothetical protein
MSAIDPALLQAQWLQYQNSQLSQSAIIPQTPQYAPQYAPQQPQGEFVSAEVMATITEFIRASNTAADAAAQYISHLQSELATIDRGYLKLAEFSAIQDALIEKFLFDRNFALDYARGTWPIGGVDNDFMSRLADTYLEIAALSPLAQQSRSPEFTGNPNMQFSAAVTPANVPQMSIPPLPSSNGSASPYITLDQYLAAQQQGQVAQARAAALQNPAGLYGALFQ